MMQLLHIERTYACYEGPDGGQSSPSWLQSFAVTDTDADAALKRVQDEIARLPTDKRKMFHAWLENPAQKEPVPTSLRKIIREMANACSCC